MRLELSGPFEVFRLNLSENLSNSFDYAKKLFSDGGRLIILIILDIIPLVNWIVIGYAARVLRETPGTDTPPKLEKYGDMFVDGAKIFFASLIYMIIPAILIFAVVGSFIASSFFGGEALGPGMLFFGGTGLVLVLVAMILAFFLLLILGVGIAHMIKTRSFGKAFAFGEILSIIRGIGWGRYIGWAVVTVIIVIVVGGIAGAIPILGWIISAIIAPILTAFVFRSLGLLYNEGAPPELKAMAPAAGGIMCASCGTPLQPYHKFCPNCGATAPAPPTAPPPPTTTAGTKFCISCGARIPATAGFCGSCGTKQM